VLDIGATNLDLVRSIYAAWERGDFSSAGWADPEIDFVIPEGPDQGRFKGVPAMAQAWGAFLNAWEGYRVEADDFFEVDRERVLVLMKHGGRGNTSGLDVEQLKTDGANLFHVRDGRVTRLVIHWDRDRALADLGLKE
jgi:ketosteroid isomerase-like protein